MAEWRAIAIPLLIAFAIATPADEPSSAIPTDTPSSAESRIVFERGAIEAVARGALTKIDDQVRFVVRARSGQQMRLIVDADGPTRGFVTFPSGDEVGSPGSNFFDDTLPADGDYHIRITESLMGESWSGKITLHVMIKSPKL
jgi:hypothetical protein